MTYPVIQTTFDGGIYCPEIDPPFGAVATIRGDRLVITHYLRPKTEDDWRQVIATRMAMTAGDGR